MFTYLTSKTAFATKRIAVLLASCLVACLATAVVSGQQGTGFGSGGGSGSASTNRSTQQGGNDATTIFRSARDLVTDGDWARAQEKFSEYVSSYPNEKNIDAALYWLAYSQYKSMKYDQCRSTIDRLLAKYPGTSWREDARVLMAQVPGSAAAYEDAMSAVRAQTTIVTMPAIEQTPIYTPSVTLSPLSVTPAIAQGIATTAVYSVDGLNDGAADDDDPCEFKIVVLQALFQTDLQRGIMAASDWLKPGSTQTVRCKSAALTLLGRNGGKAVTPVILGVARNEPDLKLRARAIASLGATNDDSVIDALRDFALNSQQNDIVEASLYALSKHTGERAITVLSEIATSGKLTTQRKMAISSIASRPGEPAVDALLRIYDTDQSLEIRKVVIAGFANRKSERAGNRLIEIARGSDNIELRKTAIGAIARRGGEKAIEFLLGLYDTEKNEELKDQIINSLGYGTGIFVGTPLAAAAVGQTAVGYNTFGSRMNDQRVIRKLIEIARSPQAPMERRKRAIGWLSRSKDPEVLKFLEELLK
jgi:Outer membrane lipoprotein/HEAT repeats